MLESIWKCQYNKKIKDNYKKINKILQGKCQIIMRLLDNKYKLKDKNFI